MLLSLGWPGLNRSYIIITKVSSAVAAPLPSSAERHPHPPPSTATTTTTTPDPPLSPSIHPSSSIIPSSHPSHRLSVSQSIERIPSDHPSQRSAVRHYIISQHQTTPDPLPEQDSIWAVVGPIRALQGRGQSVFCSCARIFDRERVDRLLFLFLFFYFIAAVVVVGKFSGASTRSRQRVRFHPHHPHHPPPSPLRGTRPRYSGTVYLSRIILWRGTRPSVDSWKWENGKCGRTDPRPPSAPSALKLVRPTSLATKPQDGLNRPG